MTEKNKTIYQADCRPQTRYKKGVNCLIWANGLLQYSSIGGGTHDIAGVALCELLPESPPDQAAALGHSRTLLWLSFLLSFFLFCCNSLEQTSTQWLGSLQPWKEGRVKSRQGRKEGNFIITIMNEASQ